MSTLNYKTTDTVSTPVPTPPSPLTADPACPTSTLRRPRPANDPTTSVPLRVKRTCPDSSPHPGRTSFPDSLAATAV